MVCSALLSRRTAVCPDLSAPSLGEFYARDLGTANLEMLSRFFEKYPDYVDKTFLVVKVSNIELSSRAKNSSHLIVREVPEHYRRVE